MHARTHARTHACTPPPAPAPAPGGLADEFKYKTEKVVTPDGQQLQIVVKSGIDVGICMKLLQRGVGLKPANELNISNIVVLSGDREIAHPLQVHSTVMLQPLVTMTRYNDSFYDSICRHLLVTGLPRFRQDHHAGVQQALRGGEHPAAGAPGARHRGPLVRSGVVCFGHW